MRLLLVRHGQTEGNVERRLQGSEDPLTPFGRQQAGEVAEHIAAHAGDVAAVYASPYARAMETANRISAALGVEPVFRDGLAELDVGEAAGYRFDDWAESFPEEAKRFRADGVAYAWPGGESGRQLGERAAREMDAVVRAHRGETVVVVSHGGTLAWALAHLLGDPAEGWPTEYLHLANCSVTEVLVSGNGEPAELVRRNEVDHLTPPPDAEAAAGERPD